MPRNNDQTPDGKRGRDHFSQPERFNSSSLIQKAFFAIPSKDNVSPSPPDIGFSHKINIVFKESQGEGNERHSKNVEEQ
jgi:hypothetical protein